MPITRMRVVCTLGETIDTFEPGAESAQAVQAEIERYSQAKEKAAGKAAS